MVAVRQRILAGSDQSSCAGPNRTAPRSRLSGVRKLASALIAIESGSKLPHSKGSAPLAALGDSEGISESRFQTRINSSVGAIGWGIGSRRCAAV